MSSLFFTSRILVMDSAPHYPVQTISINKWEPRVKNIQEKTLPTNKARNVPWRLEDTVPNGTSYYWVHSAPTGASRIVRRRRCPWRTLQWDRLEGAASHVWSFASKSPPGKQRVFCNVAPCVSRQICVTWKKYFKKWILHDFTKPKMKRGWLKNKNLEQLIAYYVNYDLSRI